jgi:hypothetical protein
MAGWTWQTEYSVVAALVAFSMHCVQMLAGAPDVLQAGLAAGCE